MATMYHGTNRSDWQPHVGACLTDDIEVARSYRSLRGGAWYIYAVEIDEAGLTVEDRTSEVDRDNQDYPGDTDADIALLVAEGLDAVTYDDEDEMARQFRCYRLLSEAAVASATAEMIE